MSGTAEDDGFEDEYQLEDIEVNYFASFNNLEMLVYAA